jgi:hypothetical protein
MHQQRLAQASGSHARHRIHYGVTAKMTMHLEGPWLSTVGKKRSKRKFRNSDVASRARDLAESWRQNLERWDKMSPNFSGKKAVTGKLDPKWNPVVPNTPVIDPKRDLRQHPSRDTGGGVAAKTPTKVYTGTKMKGIGTMHKSNSVPIFSNEEAEAIAHMRR